MGARGSCNACSHPRRDAINAAKAEGMPVATIGRTFGVATTTLVRHFKNGHARPAPAVARPAAVVTAPAAVPRHPKASDPDPEVSFAKVRQAAEYLEIPLGPFATVISDILDRDLTTASETEEEELFAAWAAAEDDDDFVAAVIRSGRFYQETAE